jgi:hypothetical protein
MGVIDNQKGGTKMSGSSSASGNAFGRSGSKGGATTKHHKLATTGRAEGMCHGGMAKGYAEGGRVAKDCGTVESSAVRGGEQHHHLHLNHGGKVKHHVHIHHHHKGK